jgi:Domain of unknown function (DUF4082)
MNIFNTSRQIKLLLGLLPASAVGSIATLTLALIPVERAQAVGLYDFTSEPPILFDSGDLTVGFLFTANSTFTINSLGFYDYEQNGLQTSHDVGIFDTSGTLLTSVTVPSGTAGELGNKFRYASIPSFTLNSGQSYVIGGQTTGLDGYNYANMNSILGFSVDPRISIDSGASRYNYGSSLTYPANGIGYDLYPMVNLSTATLPFTTVPEPFTILGTIFGAGSGVALKRKLSKDRQAKNEIA